MQNFLFNLLSLNLGQIFHVRIIFSFFYYFLIIITYKNGFNDFSIFHKFIFQFFLSPIDFSIGFVKIANEEKSHEQNWLSLN